MPTRSRPGQTQAHIDKRTEHVFAEVARHCPGRNVPTLLLAVRVIKLNEQAPVLPFLIPRPGEDLQWRTHRAGLAILGGIEHAVFR
ncbi:hypothetical protein D3C78_1142250 [compost metagenome]